MSQRRVAEIEAALAVPTISPRERKRFLAELKLLDPGFDHDAYVGAEPVTPSTPEPEPDLIPWDKVTPAPDYEDDG